MPHSLTGDTVTYTPDTGFSGTDSFKFKVNDGKEDGTGDAAVTINVGSPIVTGTVRFQGMPNPLTGAVVAFSTGSDTSQVVSNPQDGSFEVLLSMGTYDVTAAKDGFLTEMKGGLVVNQDITLPPVLLLWGDFSGDR